MYIVFYLKPNCISEGESCDLYSNNITLSNNLQIQLNKEIPL